MVLEIVHNRAWPAIALYPPVTATVGPRRSWTGRRGFFYLSTREWERFPSPSSVKFAVDDFEDNIRAQANIDRGEGPY